MTNPKNILAIIFLIAFSNYSLSQVSPNFQKLELKEKVLNESSSFKFDKKFDEKIVSDWQSNSQEKSPYLGSLFSGIIPGTGELYAQRYLKAAIFFAIEAGLWITYGIFEGNGNSATDSYQQFADQNWDVYQYANWLKTTDYNGQTGFPESGGIDLSASPDVLRQQINVCERASGFSHTLPQYGDQQYYELIGKYQTFVAGWKDANLDYLTQNNYNYHTYQSPMFVSYSYDRQQANDYYDNASTTLIFVVVNHILSAADAAWSVSAFNKDLKVRTGLHMEKIYSYYGQKKTIPVANLSISF